MPGAEKQEEEEDEEEDEEEEALELVEPVEEADEEETADEADAERCGMATDEFPLHPFCWQPTTIPLRSPTTAVPAAPLRAVPLAFSCSVGPLSSAPLPSEPDSPSDPSPRASSSLISLASKTMKPASGPKPSLSPSLPLRPRSRPNAPVPSSTPSPWH